MQLGKADTSSEQHATSGQPHPARTALTPNQKKKRRQKLAKLGKVETTENSTRMDSGSVLAGSEASTTVCMPPICRDQVSVPVSCVTVRNNDSIASAHPCSQQASSVSIRAANALAVQSESCAQLSSNRQSSAGVQVVQHILQQIPVVLAASPASTPANSAAQTEVAKTAQSQHRQRPPSSQQPRAICRQDMSDVAVLLQSNMGNKLSAPGDVAITDSPETDATIPQPPSKRQKKVFVHGNYSAYYGYRLGTELTEDPRLQVLDRRWFHNKRCLDIGCNEGVITLAVVQRFAPLSMLGVDIDEGLVKAACRALSKQRTEASQLHQRLLRHTAAELGERPAAQRKAAAAAVRAFGNVYFTCQDFANSQHASQTLDNIMCLSVTKWVHLNQGDKGLKRLFAKVADALAPGGWFILEPQPWRSYKQARRKQDMSAAPFAKANMLQLRPEAFPDYLQQELGFVLVKELHVTTSSAGFNRPMYLFQKPI